LGENSAIGWTDHTFNPWWGCAKVSPACQHCYAEAFSKRTGHNVWGVHAPRRFFGEKHWLEPTKWNRAAAKAGTRQRVFCASMADVFEDRADVDDARSQLYGLIEATPMLDWLLLTKRPENVRRMLPVDWLSHPRPNVWFGTTAENDEYLDERGRHMADIPAAVRFLSYEPALGPLSLLPDYTSLIPSGRRVFDWVIAGGESGANHRAPDPAWFREVRDTCVEDGVPFFFKQWGGKSPKANGSVLDGREWKQFPGRVLEQGAGE